MGPPALLPDFAGLSRQIAEGSGLTIEEFEPEDRFLHRVKDAGPDVHRLAVQILQANDPEPTELHRNLLRLYTSREDVRIVTTNFDRLFERTASDSFDPAPKVFQAPDLPLGRRFQGIVHIHGTVDEPTEMVLTSQDFGRAYLTEADGWARRFLVDVFANYTVLFVGYSHQDTIMTYLTPSLPPDGSQQRFALVGDWKPEEQGHWRRMGVEPVVFQQARADDFDTLDLAVAGLADRIGRGILDWQCEIAEIGRGYPPAGPIDDERAGIIDDALTDPVKTRFFVSSAESPEWIGWLDRRGRLDSLFADAELSHQEVILVRWLVSSFALTYDHELFALIERHGRRLNPVLWRELCLQMQHCISESPDQLVLTRWVLFLTSIMPMEPDEFTLSWLAEASASVGATEALLRVYEAMTARLDRAPPSVQRVSDMFHYEMQTMLSEFIKPNLPEMAQPLLAVTTTRLNARHATLNAWEVSDSYWGWDNLNRAAIEPHEQNNMDGEIDPLIDTARECLEWLAVNRADAARLWSETHATSTAPLLRRLAVHTLSVRTDLSADEKIAWLLEHCDIHEDEVHHEMFRAASIAYPLARIERRSAFINAVEAYLWPDETTPDRDRYTARRQFNWLHWLNEAAPDCQVTSKALDDIRNRNPEFQPPEHADFNRYHWSGLRATGQSPWTVDDLLARPAAETLVDLLAYQPSERQIFDGQDRGAMLRAVTQAAQANPFWGLDLADALAETRDWRSDFWDAVIAAWENADLDQESVKRVLSHLSSEALHRQHVREIARVLYQLVGKAAASAATTLPEEANSLAASLRHHAAEVEIPSFTSSVGGVPQEVDWFHKAINHPSGKLAEFWAESIALWCRQYDTPPGSMTREHRRVLDAMMQDMSDTGKLARTILARYCPWLLWADEDWTRQNLIPLLDPGHNEFVSAWDGLVYSGQLTPRAADLLNEPFLKAVERVNRELAGPRKKRFITRYIGMLTRFASGPVDEWITKIFTCGDSEVRHQFSMELTFHLRELDDERKKEWWSIWLKDYWENRWLGVPVQLDDVEIENMLGWTNLLSPVYPEAVDLAVRMRPIQLQRGTIIRQLVDNDLVNQYPEAVAKLVIHLGKTDQRPWTWHRAKAIFDKLLESELDAETGARLRETMVRIAFW